MPWPEVITSHPWVQKANQLDIDCTMLSEIHVFVELFITSGLYVYSFVISKIKGFVQSSDHIIHAFTFHNTTRICNCIFIVFTKESHIETIFNSSEEAKLKSDIVKYSIQVIVLQKQKPTMLNWYINFQVTVCKEQYTLSMYNHHIKTLKSIKSHKNKLYNFYNSTLCNK